MKNAATAILLATASLPAGALNDDDNGYNSGSAYIFTRVGNAWSQQAKLLPFDGVAGDYFGRSVSLDGDTALIGAADYDGFEPGSAYVFTRAGGVWTQQAKLRPADASTG